MLLQALRKPAMVVASVLAVLYLVYRVCFTLNLITPYAIVASLLLLIGESYGIIMLLLYFLQAWDLSDPPQQPALPNRTVDVLVTTYNEDAQLLRATLQACLRMDYAHRTYVLDDGRRPEVKALADELGVRYITRPNNQHAKAGNLNNALKQTDGEFVIIFDADHVPEKHFITRLIGYFADEKLAFVQTPHAFYNLDSFQASHDADKRSYWEEGEIFYQVIQLGKNRFNCAIFAGSAAMFRRKALEEIGYMAVETITEDMHTGLRLNARGWKSLAISERLIAGQAAPDVTTFHTQRLRWAKGNLSILSVDHPLTIPGLSLGQRLCHLASCLYWLGGVFRLPVYLTPLLFLFTGVSPVGELSGLVLVLALLYLVITWSVVTLVSNRHFSFWNCELFDMMSFWTKTCAVGALLWRIPGKFVVTSKRGRQSNNIWPLLRPHLVLIVITIVALCWGWSRFVRGVSDDWSKLVLSSVWALFYMSLAFVVIRRALAPDDARYDYRHPVNLGVAYAAGRRGRRKVAPRLGLTLDVSESGLGILTYQPMKPGTLLTVELHGAGVGLYCRGRVAWSRPLLGEKGTRLRAFRSGVALSDLSGPQRDVLQHLCMHYAVSRQYRDIAMRGAADFAAHALGSGLADRCLPYRLPVALDIPGAYFRASYCTEAVASSGIKVLLPMPLAPNTKYTFRIGTPLGDIRGESQVVCCEPLSLAGGMYHLCTLVFLDLAEQDRAIWDSLVKPPGREKAAPTVLQPRRQKRRLPIKRPLAMIARVVLPLVLLQYFAFSMCYRDDLRLRDIIAASSVKMRDIEDVRRISNQTDRQRYASTDRLTLLRRAWQRVGNQKQMDRLTDVLATRYPGNLGLQVALLDVHVRNRDLEKVRALHQHIATTFAYRFIPKARKKDLIVVVARACVHCADFASAADCFARALQMSPADRDIRREYAGILLQSDRPQAVLALYGADETSTTHPSLLAIGAGQRTKRPQDVSERSAADCLVLAAAQQRLNHFVEAERECRLALQEKPDDIEGRLQLAETLRAMGKKQEAAALYASVAKVDPSNERLRMGLAFTAVGDGNYTRALDLFRPLAASDSKRMDLIGGFIDAAAGAHTLTTADRSLILCLFEQINRDDEQRLAFADRLSWALQKMGEYKRSAALLRFLIAQGGTNRDLRLRLAVCLGALNRNGEALKVLAPLGMDTEAVCLSAGLSLRKGDAARAEKTCRAVLASAPDNARILNMLAMTLAAEKQFDMAEEALHRLARLRPNDLAPRIHLAEVSLWKKDYPTALARYEQLLAGVIQQPSLWPGFADAASGCEGRMTGQQKQLALQLAQAFVGSKDIGAAPLTRLGYALARAKASPAVVRSLLKAAIRRVPEDDVAARKELAGVLAVADMPQEALTLYRGLNLTIEEQCQVAYIHVTAHQGDLAEALVRKLCQHYPDDFELQHSLANVLAWSKRYDAAIRVYQQMLRTRPNDIRAQAGLAQVHLWARHYDTSLALYRKLLVAHPDLKRYYAGYIDAAASATAVKGRVHRSIINRLVKWARGGGCTELVMLKRLSWVCQRTKNRKAAVQLLHLARKLDPDDNDLILQLADTLYEMGRYHEAEKEYLLAAYR